MALCYSSISDIAALAKLTNLTKLVMDYTRVADVTPLAKLTGLKDLSIQGSRLITEQSLSKTLPEMTGLVEFKAIDWNFPGMLVTFYESII